MADMKKVYDDLIIINLYKQATRAAYYTFLPIGLQIGAFKFTKPRPPRNTMFD